MHWWFLEHETGDRLAFFVLSRGGACCPRDRSAKSKPTLVKALRSMFPSLCTFELAPLLLFFCLCQSGPRAWPLHMTSSPCPFLTQGLLPTSLELLCRKARVDAGPPRFCSLIDSNVARCATSKGRSSSSSLMTVLQRAAAVSVAFGLYGALPFCPTRIMPADAPSREADIFAPVLGCGLSRSMVMPYCTFLVSRDGPQTGQGSFCGQLPGPLPGEDARFKSCAFKCWVNKPLQFDSSLGFPGEGTLFLLGWVWLVFFSVKVPFAGFALVACSHGVFGALQPRHAGDTRRQQLRNQNPLPEGRPCRKLLDSSVKSFGMDSKASLQALLKLCGLQTSIS